MLLNRVFPPYYGSVLPINFVSELKQEASQWHQNLGVQSKRRLERFPHSRENILKKCFAELAGDPYLMDVESLLGSLRSADRKLNSYLKRLPKREEIRKMHKSGEILLRVLAEAA